MFRNKSACIRKVLTVSRCQPCMPHHAAVACITACYVLARMAGEPWVTRWLTGVAHTRLTPIETKQPRLGNTKNTAQSSQDTPHACTLSARTVAAHHLHTDISHTWGCTLGHTCAAGLSADSGPVSYTHLTLPTIYSV